MGEPVLRLEIGGGLDGYSRQGERRHSWRWERVVWNHFRADVFQRHFGPAWQVPLPNYDMQRVLATRNPREASLMNGMVNVVLYFPRYMMITGITIMALAFYMTELRGMEKPDFEKIFASRVVAIYSGGSSGFFTGGIAGGVHVELCGDD